MGREEGEREERGGRVVLTPRKNGRRGRRGEGEGGGRELSTHVH